MANFPPMYMPPQQGYGYMQPPMGNQMQDAFLCRPVASREEAIGTPTDFSRALVMPDFGHGMIYVKRFNPNTGSSDFLDFRHTSPAEAAPAQEYVTRQEFDKFCSDLMRRIVGAGKEPDDE